jgi:hypothetical protein
MNGTDRHLSQLQNFYQDEYYNAMFSKFFGT